MNKKLQILNVVLVIGIMAILAVASNLWLNPAHSLHVETAASGASQKFEAPPPLRENYPPTIQEAVIKQNLFRKERTEYVSPASLLAQAGGAVPKSSLPPPNLKVSGLMLFSHQKKVAVLEGTYSVLNGTAAVENKTLKKKGYNLGEQIGSYHITDMNRTTVFLDDHEGSIVSVNLVARSPEDRIQRNGNHFFHKNKSSRPAPAPAGATAPSTPPPPPAHISGASAPSPAPATPSPQARISGAVTTPPPPQSAAVSGAATTPPPPQGAAISGASSAKAPRISGG